MTTNRTLPQIAKAIKVLEKKSIQNVIEIGKLLQEASKKCEHGEYMDWLKTEFGWSHGTSLNYRNVATLAQNRKIYDFDKLNISISALYLAARCLLKDDQNPSDQAAGKAIIEAAKRNRVTYQMACDLFEIHHGGPPTQQPAEPDPKQDSPTKKQPRQKPPADDDGAVQGWWRLISRLAKLMALTTSDNDGEALNAVRAANRLMDDEELVWEEVLTPKPQPKTARRRRDTANSGKQK